MAGRKRENVPSRDPSLPYIQERQALQNLLSGGWKPARAIFPTNGEITLAKMVRKGWVERRRLGLLEFRITDAGRAAFRARLPDYSRLQ